MMPKPRHDLFEDDPFGPDTSTASLPPLEPKGGTGGGQGLSLDRHVNGRKDGRQKQTDHGRRVRTMYESRGYLFVKVEWTQTLYGGQLVKRDLLGLFDYLAISATEIVGVQVSDEAHWRHHLRKMCSDEIDKASGQSRLQNTLAWIAGPGRRIQIVGYEKRAKVANQEWFAVEHEVTRDEIEKTLARRRK